MRFITKLTITGMKRSKGRLDNGQEFDSTKVYGLTSLDDRKGNGMGQATVEYAFGTSDEYEKFKHLAGSFPLEVEADVELVTTGSSQRTVIHALKPTQRAASAPAAAAAVRQ